MRLKDSTIFIVEDDTDYRFVLKTLIAPLYPNIEVFTSGEDFLNRKIPNSPCCLLSDVRMPGLSGIALQETIKGAGKTIPIVFITGYTDISICVKAMKNGAVDYLVKPFNEQALLDAIHRALKLDLRLKTKRAAKLSFQHRHNSLTPRERETLCHMVTGITNKEIAALMKITIRTVKAHRERVMTKMKVDSLIELVRLMDKFT